MKKKNNKKKLNKEKCPMWLLACAILSVFVIFYCFSDNNKAPKKPTDIVDIDRSTAITICNYKAKTDALYDYKTSYDVEIMELSESWLIYIKGAKFQNIFGTFMKSNVYCNVDKTGRRDLVDYFSLDLISEYRVY